MDIPQKYLAQVLAPLVRQGLLVAVAGPDGGYALSRDPEAVTLLDVVEAAEGSIGGQRCLLSGVPCNLDETCAVHETWRRAQLAMAAELRGTTLADLVMRDQSPSRRPENEAAAPANVTYREVG
jgi:Rrf2 family protein